MSNKTKYLPLLFAALLFHQGCTPTEGSEADGEIPAEVQEANKAEVDERFMAIDNRCAWPNLTVLKDGSIVATIFNQPSHARQEGDVECWASSDGRFWELRGTPAVHDKDANRMNVAAGLANNGDLVVVASGWSLKPPATTGGARDLIAVLRAWVSRSSDGGRTWKVAKDAFPAAESSMTEFIPFGDILTDGDGSLRVLAYAQSLDKETNKVSMFRSEDDGRTWALMSFISDGKNVAEVPTGHNETAFLHLGGGKWIAAARRWRAGQAMDLFRSADDGKTWEYRGQLTKDSQHPGHLLRLKNGNILLTYGNRIKGQYGVAARISDDEGKNWKDEIIVIDDLTSGDSGYPSSTQLPDGRIMTAYYSVGVPSHQRYHMGTVIWNLP
jgi:Neuraminidase (sialidase)